MAGMAGKITGKLQVVVATLFWSVGMGLASAGIVADSRLHVGYELGDFPDVAFDDGVVYRARDYGYRRGAGGVYRPAVGATDRQQP